MPGMLQEPRSVSGLKSGLSAWAKHCSKYYQKWGLTITGFVIDGEAPGLDSTVGLLRIVQSEWNSSAEDAFDIAAQ